MFALQNHRPTQRATEFTPLRKSADTGVEQRYEQKVFFKPPYVGARGWVGIELTRISDKDLNFHIK